MRNKISAKLLLLLVTTFFSNAVGFCCFSDENSFVSSHETVLTAVSSAADSSASGNTSFPKNHALSAFFSDAMHTAYINGGNPGSRQFQPVAGRLLLTIRLTGDGEHILRGGYSSSNDIRSLYGFVRPHLFFCRLLI